ncbi:MAG TPA: hypothetical protein VHC68_01245 [Candidatus Paceibacterota bacterium]|nr:hypothetical protein [Candidatus Paceibacterota bacterium]
MRIVGTALFFLLAAAGLVLAVRDNLSAGLLAAPAAALPAPPVELVGTIEYYPDNLGTPVPYLVYAPQRDKALLFDSASACVTAAGTYSCALISQALHAYYPGKVAAEGVIEAEHLRVSRLAPA